MNSGIVFFAGEGDEFSEGFYSLLEGGEEGGVFAKAVVDAGEVWGKEGEKVVHFIIIYYGFEGDGGGWMMGEKKRGVFFKNV